ncbi:MAG: DUF4347 domain-containing protein, partial [Cyanobacteria bacterium P01_A01_bin.80]
MKISSSEVSQDKDWTMTQKVLVAIDSNLDNVQDLVADIQAKTNVEIILLDAKLNGVEQISNILKKHTRVSSLHIVSHGSSGCLHLGNTNLSFETLDDYEEQLKNWSKVLQGADILLYGCQVAQGVRGYLFLQQLYQLTGANIAASENRVGSKIKGGTWELDSQIGEINSHLIFSPHLQETYKGYFDPEVSFSLSTDTLVESEGTPFSFNFSLSEPPPAEGTVVRLEGSIAQAINQWDLFSLTTSGLADFPVDVSPGQDFSAFEVTIIEQNASISAPIFNDGQDDSPQEITWNVTAVSGGTISPGAGSATVTIYDDPGEVPSQNPEPPAPEPTTPEISLSADVTTLVEDEGSSVTLTFNLSEPPPEDGVVITVGTGKEFALGDFDIFPPPPQASTTGGSLVAGNSDNSGFTFNITEQTATINLPIFDDPDRPADDPDSTRNDDIGEEQTTFSIAAGDGYTVGGNGSVTLTLRDTNAPPEPENTAPTADDDSYNTDFETELTVNAANGVLDGDADADGDTLTATIVSEAENGSVTLNNNGSFTYTPDAGFFGTVFFTFSANVGEADSNTATVSVTVADAPEPEPPTEPPTEPPA